MSAIIYDFKTKKRISSCNKLKLKEYSLKIIYECLKGHQFAEEYFSYKIIKFGVEECVKNSFDRNENKLCPECNETIYMKNGQ